ncbi:unnamed protein product [Phytophthora lilii]|uniref:Unnamed protein product n=1 Tax=Phytophthora lilii TaxID=2077276 RepID=A0A9W6WLT7_9STRA|nr:unnamed protein product [Phytophthora lilii]
MKISHSASLSLLSILRPIHEDLCTPSSELEVNEHERRRHAEEHVRERVVVELVLAGRPYEALDEAAHELDTVDEQLVARVAPLPVPRHEAGDGAEDHDGDEAGEEEDRVHADAGPDGQHHVDDGGQRDDGVGPGLGQVAAGGQRQQREVGEDGAGQHDAPEAVDHAVHGGAAEADAEDARRLDQVLLLLVRDVTHGLEGHVVQQPAERGRDAQRHEVHEVPGQVALVRGGEQPDVHGEGEALHGQQVVGDEAGRLRVPLLARGGAVGPERPALELRHGLATGLRHRGGRRALALRQRVRVHGWGPSGGGDLRGTANWRVD